VSVGESFVSDQFTEAFFFAALFSFSALDLAFFLLFDFVLMRFTEDRRPDFKNEAPTLFLLHVLHMQPHPT
jgi:hypothetical protein